MLLRKLQNASYLSTVSHIILDEVHERGVSVILCALYVLQLCSVVQLLQQQHQQRHLCMLVS